MYETFFGFRERPFAAAPVAERYFAGDAIEAARQTLARCVDRAEGAGLLVGPAGTGKTLLCHVLAEQFRNSLEVALLGSGRLCSRRALLQAILFELGLPYRGMEEGDLRLSLIDHLSPRPGAAETTKAGLLLIVDEAHTLPFRLMEELRLITNLVRNGQPRVRLILAGGPQLEERFASAKLESIQQRIAARCYLESLDRAQTIDYVRYKIEQVGSEAEAIFTDDALEAVYHATDGIPRLINQVCDHALLLAYAGGARQLHAAGIEEAWSDLQQLPTPWNASDGAAAAADTETRAPDIVEFGQLGGELEDLPAAVPFPGSSQTSTDTAASIHRRLPAESQLAATDDDFEPAGSIRPEVELMFPALLSTSTPFHQPFDEEEVVIDRYTSQESDALANRPLVRSAESRELGALLSPFATPAPSIVAIAPITWPGGMPTTSASTNAETYDENRGEEAAKASAAEPADSTGWPGSSAAEPPVADRWGLPSVDPSHPTSDLNHPPSETMPADDDDLIVIEEPAERTIDVSRTPSPKAHRREYRQLFAQLRRG